MKEKLIKLLIESVKKREPKAQELKSFILRTWLDRETAKRLRKIKPSIVRAKKSLENASLTEWVTFGKGTSTVKPTKAKVRPSVDREVEETVEAVKIKRTRKQVSKDVAKKGVRGAKGRYVKKGDINDANLEELANMKASEMMARYGIGQIQKSAKDLGVELDYDNKTVEFAKGFQFKLKEILGL